MCRSQWHEVSDRCIAAVFALSTVFLELGKVYSGVLVLPSVLVVAFDFVSTTPFFDLDMLADLPTLDLSEVRLFERERMKHKLFLLNFSWEKTGIVRRGFKPKILRANFPGFFLRAG
ncbi:hypothetical protein SBF1_50040 [Candidatus Desulfosporosinus infrequens]|uniref:Uncharacterized protein n=1 Tax=Candidatus Desulfosporosinus infrequens TaxID=2043169 RepID=A0A2U3LH69_9FIRM|nr:hypothetical protein SBF1_50040 [Candidatus Desulfosporosinus infrequens]